MILCTFSETNRMDTGLLIEVWSKGMLWDKAMGYHWLYLQNIPHTNEVSPHFHISKNLNMVICDVRRVSPCHSSISNDNIVKKFFRILPITVFRRFEACIIMILISNMKDD